MQMILLFSQTINLFSFFGLKQKLSKCENASIASLKKIDTTAYGMKNDTTEIFEMYFSYKIFVKKEFKSYIKYSRHFKIKENKKSHD